MFQHFLRVDTDRLSAQQILNLHFFQTGYGDIAVDQLISSGNGPEFTAGLLADIQNFFSRLHTGRRNCEDDLINTISSHSIQNTISATDDRYSAHQFTVTSGLVIDNAFGPHTQIAAVLDLLEDHITAGSRTDDHDIDTMFLTQQVHAFIIDQT